MSIIAHHPLTCQVHRHLPQAIAVKLIVNIVEEAVIVVNAKEKDGMIILYQPTLFNVLRVTEMEDVLCVMVEDTIIIRNPYKKSFYINQRIRDAQLSASLIHKLQIIHYNAKEFYEFLRISQKDLTNLTCTLSGHMNTGLRRVR